MSTDSSLLTGSTRRLLETFGANNISCEVVDGQLNIIRYRTRDGGWHQLKGMLSEKVPVFSKQICDDKWWAFRLFRHMGLPSPVTLQYDSPRQLRDFVAQHQTIVIKPRFGAHGHGVTMGITPGTDLLDPIGLAKTFSPQVLIQQQIAGLDVRLLVVGDTIVSALERRPAVVVGDGSSTIYELIRRENKKPQRGKQGIDTLVAIPLPAVKQYLTDIQLRRTPAAGEVVRVVGPSNQSLGGTVHDISDKVPATLCDDTLRLVSHLQMPIAGVDCIMTSDGYYFLEINASPGIAIHDDPALGIQSGCFVSYMELLHQDAWWRA